MVKRYRHWLGEDARHMVESFDGDYVLYTDHLAAMEEKDKDYGRIFLRQLDVIKEQDKEIERLKTLVADLTLGCMDNVEVRTAVREDSDG